MAITHELNQGIAEIVIDRPPVNALDVKSWFELADIVRGLGARWDVRVLDPARRGAWLQRRRRHQGAGA